MRTTNIFHRFHFYCLTRYRCPHSDLVFLPTRFLHARLVDLNFHVIVRFNLLVSAWNVTRFFLSFCVLAAFLVLFMFPALVLFSSS